MPDDLVLFNLGAQHYALPVSHVSEVVPRARLSLVPRAPSAVLGMLRLRGELVPVVDLRVCLGLRTIPADLAQRILITRTAAGHVGLLADGVRGVSAPPRADTETSRPGSRDDVVDRVHELDGCVVTLLNPWAILTPSVTAYLVGLAAPLQPAAGTRA